MREQRDVITEFGVAKIHVAVCEVCGAVTTSSASYAAAGADWFQVRVGSPASHDLDFCCVGCMIAHYAPGYFDVDPEQVKSALMGLQKIEVDLGGSKAPSPVPW